jgi:serine/threonine protein kinase
MPSDSSNAHDALHDQADPKREPEGDGTGGGLQSGKTPQAASILGDEAVDSEDTGRALLAELTVGSVIDGKYRVDEVLGRGAMGVVVAATHLELGERVALKFLRYRSKAGVTDDFQSRFKREARVSAKLKNEHITRVIDVGVWRQHVPYMVMDHLSGTDLRQILKTNGQLPIATAIEYTVQVCEGIAEAHAHGVVHRDLKPSNLFVTQRPDGSDLVKILDFGISKWSADETELDDLTQTGVVLGSPKYMAPEQLFGSSEVDARADVWSIGTILYEMLAGRPPFDFPTFTKICAELSTDRLPPPLAAKRSDVPADLEAVVMRCFERTPDRRIRDVAELAGQVLDTVQAPFADQVRSKIAATLEIRNPRDPLGGMSTGSHGKILTQSGTGRSVVQMPGSPAAESTGSSPASISGPQVAEKKRLGLWIGVVAVALVGGGVFLASRGAGDPASKQAATTPATADLPPPAIQPTATQPTTAVPTATAAATATANASASSAPSSSPAHTGFVHAPWRAPPPRITTTSAPPPVAATAAPPPATTTATAPVATTPPPTTPKPDPLGERQ